MTKVEAKDMATYLRALFSVLILAFLLSGCFSFNRYGRLTLSARSGNRMTIEKLKDNWQEYHVYYDGVSVDYPSAILFDPKGDDSALAPATWVRLEDQESIFDVIHWLKVSELYVPLLYDIVGPDNVFYGFFYSPWGHVNMRVLDDGTMWVDDLVLPPIDYGPSRVGP